VTMEDETPGALARDRLRKTSRPVHPIHAYGTPGRCFGR
jgi:hypothetical protein